MLKKIDLYVLKTFFPLLIMTFLISWFIVLMQFLWKYVEDLVGKGLSVFVVGQAIFYAAMHLVPLALPLGILLASLMTFGNLGERLELLSMKASGVPLYRIMRPLLFSVVLIALGLFYFLNSFMITAQVKLWTIIYSARQASPELEIPEGSFYSEIKGYNIYVKHRDKKTGTLHDLMIYDYTKGFDNIRIIRADSGRIVMDESKTFLSWTLYRGQSFENVGNLPSPSDPTPISHAIEKFRVKEIIIPFNANFNLMGQEHMSSLFIGKNLNQLSYAIDTASLRIDSIRNISKEALSNLVINQRYTSYLPSVQDTSVQAQQERAKFFSRTSQATAIGLDSMWRMGKGLSDSLRIIAQAESNLAMMRSEAELRLDNDREAFRFYRTHREEWHRKFTFPVACIVFFFIGAPLGAIIRKGGLGMPVVASVLFFIIYYIIDTFGRNMSSQESLPVWLGIWLSALVLFPVGAFLTYKASRDSATLNMEVYILFFKRLFGNTSVRKIEIKEVVMQEVDYNVAQNRIRDLKDKIARARQASWAKVPAWSVWLECGNANREIEGIARELEELIEELRNSTRTLLVVKLMDIPVLPTSLGTLGITRRWQGVLLIALLPISIPATWLLSRRRTQVLGELIIVERLLSELIELSHPHREKVAIQN